MLFYRVLKLQTGHGITYDTNCMTDRYSFLKFQSQSFWFSKCFNAFLSSFEITNRSWHHIWYKLYDISLFHFEISKPIIRVSMLFEKSSTIFMVSASQEKPTSARSVRPLWCLDLGVSVLFVFAGKAWRERTFGAGLASSECKTGVPLLLAIISLYSLCCFIIGLCCGKLS